MRKIELTKGKVVLVDDEDYDRAVQFSWFCNSQGYAARSERLPDGRITTVRMHRWLLDAPAGVMVDHRNGDRLDNRRGNLRQATRAENLQNRAANKNNTSGYKGVSLIRSSQKWRAVIGHEGRLKFLGSYLTAEEAALAYDAAAREIHGSFARLNFPEQEAVNG